MIQSSSKKSQQVVTRESAIGHASDNVLDDTFFIPILFFLFAPFSLFILLSGSVF